MDGLVTVKKAAELLACSEALLRKAINKKRLPIVKVGRLIRIRLSDLQAWLRLGLDNSDKGENQCLI